MSALDNRGMRGDARHVGVGVAPPQVDPHLEVAEHHPQHREQIRHKEEDDVVPGIRIRNNLIPIKRNCCTTVEANGTVFIF